MYTTRYDFLQYGRLLKFRHSGDKTLKALEFVDLNENEMDIVLP